jgi:limonene-1,2-epoxide hydrolase
MSARDVVAAFIAAVERKDVDAAMALLDDDVSYENMPMQPIVGADSTRAVLVGFLGAATRVEWPVVRELVAGNVVMNERLDRFEINGGWLELPVAGVFEVNDAGRIVLWRDYFDMGAYTRQLSELTG